MANVKGQMGWFNHPTGCLIPFFLTFGISRFTDFKTKIGHKGSSHLWPIDLADAKG
jgi:hypothetical protein